MKNPGDPQLDVSLSLAALERIDKACLAFEDAWKSGDDPHIEEALSETAGNELESLLCELVRIELEYRRHHSDVPTVDEYLARFPEHGAAVEAAFARRGESKLEYTATGTWRSDDAESDTLTCEQQLPSAFGDRYDVTKLLGEGGFGSVFLGYDRQLERPVAIKVLHANKVGSDAHIADLEQEARNLAALQHPSIVSVFDVGREDDGDFYLVMQYIAGCSLKALLRRGDADLHSVVRGLTQVAEAVHHAHVQGVFHRDLKPANILVDHQHRYHVADFGLAIRESTKRGQLGQMAGTPIYMSPEQVRGESHRVNCGTDIWAIGVILYQVLCGRSPFPSDRRSELFEMIRHTVPDAPSAYRDGVPEELERICLKCLAKRTDERYATAQELAEDIDRWDKASISEGTTSPRPSPVERVVPRGLRSFSEKDRGFFLDLLPGPRNRDHLPVSVEFWKIRIDSVEREQTFDCGLLYGPSGSGKTSFVKAGILPLIGDHVVPLHVEASPGITEARLLAGLKDKCPTITDDMNLVEACAAARRGSGLPFGQKVTIFIDQFEQWLHEHQTDVSSVLVDALRQCNGTTLQCILMVRDDFWLAATRFMQALEVAIVEGRNVGLIDVFDRNHARHILSQFGQAYGRLPPRLETFGPQENKFLDQAVQDLAEDGRVVPVRLSLFAEMMQSRDWQPQTLKRYGGAAGLGIAFLEESFDAPTANPINRKHSIAAKQILHGLLPEPGSELKGRMRAYQQLESASGYADRPGDFAEVLQILDRQLRLITPVDSGPLREGDDPDKTAASNAPERCYQLSHDYLVRPIRQWLQQKQRETWQGRARLVLAERAGHWRNNQDRRNLPTLSEYSKISLGVSRGSRSQTEQELLDASHRHYLLRGLLLAALVAGALSAAWFTNGTFQGRRIADAIIVAAPEELPPLLSGDYTRYRSWVTPHLVSTIAAPGGAGAEKLRARLALVDTDTAQVPYLLEDLYDSAYGVFPLVRTALADHQEQVSDKLWNRLKSRDAKDSERLRAGLALATYVPQSAEWSPSDLRFLADMLLSAHPDDQPVLRGWLKPLREALRPSFLAAYRSQERDPVERVAAATTLADYERDNLGLLAELLAEATPAQFNVLLPSIRAAEKANEQFTAKLSALLVPPPNPPQHDEADQVRLGRQRANAFACLLRLGKVRDALTVFSYGGLTEMTTQFSLKARQLQVMPMTLISGLERVATADGRFALLLAVGQFSKEDLSEAEGKLLVELLRRYRAEDADAGVHGLAGQLLEQFSPNHRAFAVSQDVHRAGFADREWMIGDLAGREVTFIRIAPGKFMMGSPPGESERSDDEPHHRVRIERPFAISSHEITRGQYKTYLQKTGKFQWPDVPLGEEFDNHAMIGVRWSDAILFCRWATTEAGMSEDDQCYAAPKGWKLNADQLPIDVGFRQERSGYRLPTEEEWEYVCRGGTSTAFNFGADRAALSEFAWYLANSSGSAQVVAQGAPSRRGLFDIHGNASEWCQDIYRKYKTPDPVPIGKEPEETSNRILRGGAWHHHAGECRSAYRHSAPPNLARSGYGFRLVRTIVD